MLTTAALISRDNLHIGITSDEMISKKDSQEILQTYHYRRKIIEEFVRDIGYNKGLSLDVINNTSGKAGNSVNLQALIITMETLNGGNFVNEVNI